MSRHHTEAALLLSTWDGVDESATDGVPPTELLLAAITHALLALGEPPELPDTHTGARVMVAVTPGGIDVTLPTEPLTAEHARMLAAGLMNAADQLGGAS